MSRWRDCRVLFIVGFCALFLLVPKTTTAATLAADDLWEKGFNNHGSIMLLIDTESGKILKANQAAATFYGYSVDQLQKMNIAQIHMYSPEEVERERLAAASEERNHFIFPHRLASGEVRTVEVHSYPIDEEQSLLFSVINDITARQVAENELLDRNSRLRRAEVLTGLGSWELRLSDNQLFLSDGAERILGLVSGASLEDLDAVTVPEYREVRQQALQALIEENIPYDIELKFERPGDGAIIDVHSVGEYDPETNSVFGSLLDITEQRAAEKSLEVSRKREIYSFWTFFLFQLIAIFVLVTNILQRRKAQQELQQNLQRNESLVHILQRQLDEIKYLSYHDQLTGLYNRRFFEKKLQELDVAENLPLSLIIADLNNLKLVNDTFGHVVGDQFLQRTAEVIKKTCHAKDIVARWGGDEFVLLLPKTTSHGAQAIMQRIEKSIREETVGSMSISIALGWSTKTKSGEALSAVFKNAENHMYRSKLVQGSGIRAETIHALMVALYETNRREEQHSKRVSALCQYLGEKLGLSDQNVKELAIIGLFHDIGKIAIEEQILNKPSALTEDEWQEIMRHPEVGYRLLGAVQEMEDIASYVLAHHERWDGTGYPKGIQGEDIPLQSRIVAVADAYDAMVSERPYRKSMTKCEALNELKKNAGSQFDPHIVDVFVDVIDALGDVAASS